MQPARGDQRPCTNAGCAGMMQFGRESDNGSALTQPAPSSFTSYDPTGWVCTKEPGHFRKDA